MKFYTFAWEYEDYSYKALAYVLGNRVFILEYNSDEWEESHFSYDWWKKSNSFICIGKLK